MSWDKCKHKDCPYRVDEKRSATECFKHVGNEERKPTNAKK